MFSVYPIPLWWLREYIALSYYHYQISSMNYYPLFRVRSWHNGMRCISLYILMKLWYGRIASWAIRVLVAFAPNLALCHWHALLPRVTPGIYVFTSIFFHRSVPGRHVSHSVSIWWDPCVRACVPLMNCRSPPHEKTISYKGWPSSPLVPSEGAFELMHGSASIIGW